MRRRQYLAAASSLFVAGCTGLRTTVGGYERPSGTEPLSGSFSTPSGDARWTVEVDSDSSLSTPDDVYVYSEAGIDRFSPDGTHRWHVDTDDKLYDEPSSITSGGSTLYHELALRRGQSLMARDVATGDERWTYDTVVHTITASESAVFVGVSGDGGGGDVTAIDANSGEKRWRTGLGRNSTAVLTHDLCLVQHWKGSLSALDVTTGEQRWKHEYGTDTSVVGTLQVVGDTLYWVNETDVAAYALPAGEELWRRQLDPELKSLAAAAPGDDRMDTIVAGSRDGTLHGFDAETGETEWALKLPGSAWIGTIARWEETIAVVGDGLLYGFDIASGEEQWRQELGPVSSADLRAVIDGTLFVMTTAEDDERHLETYDVESGRRRWRRAFGDGGIDDGVAADRFVVLTEAGELSGFRAD